jgi:putative transposase
VSAYRLIEAEKATYPVSVLCRVLKVSRSGYYDWKDRSPSKRDRENTALSEKIREIHDRSRGIYGYPRVHAELRALGVRCSRKRVARLMRKAALQGCIRGCRKRTTRRDEHAVPAPDLVGGNFAAAAPNKVWTADITYVHTQEGFLYLAFILDVYSRRVVGWSMAHHLRAELVVDALEMALFWRGKPTAGLVHHSERGVQYTSLSFGKRLQEAGIVPSMGQAGSALDNAISESFVASVKCELLYGHRFPSREAARIAIFDYIEGFYNRVRRHSSLGYLSPDDYERATIEEVAVA